MLRVFAFDGGGPREIDDPDRISDLLEDEDTAVWIDICDAADGEISKVQAECNLHDLAIEDATKHGQRPKLEIYENNAFVVAYATQECDGEQELIEVDIFLGRQWIITIHDRSRGGAHFDIEAVRERLGRSVKRSTSSSFLLYVVLDEIVDTYFSAIDDFGEQVDAIEERIFAEVDPEADELPIQRDMLVIRKNLLEFRRKVVPLREVLIQLLRDDIVWIDQDARHYLQDVFDHIMRITDEIDTRRELIGNAVDAHLAMVSNHMNMTMKKMTSWGAILIVATLVAGVYGMNFDDMPELHWRYGYYGALAAMFALTGSLYLYFKRKRWL